MDKGFLGSPTHLDGGINSIPQTWLHVSNALCHIRDTPIIHGAWDTEQAEVYVI